MKGWFVLAFELFLLCDVLGWVQLGWTHELRTLAHVSTLGLLGAIGFLAALR